uniref:prostaglandin-endoperoxide synthase n=1 Tax=Gersemia fruticosa TaxID=134440 RepID=Q9GPF4_9CNID|nr:cyclooxygenase [Gersemia fruticosa]
MVAKFVVFLGLQLILCSVVCEAVNPCCSFPCESGAVCVEDGDKYTCDCTRTGHYGVNCEKPNWSTWFKALIAPSEETKHFILTHFKWFWWIVNNVPFIRNTVMKAAYFSRTDFVPVPHAYTSYHDYATMEAHYNRSYFARTLPPVPKNCPTPFGVAGKKELPPAEEVANKFLKRGKFKTDHTSTSWLFMFFAQHFTHEFFKTIYHSPAFTWGNHGVDVSHIYGQDMERQNKLRSFEDGKLKSQTINGEEWPPYLKDVDNVTMQYPPNTPEDQKFALGHPFYSMLPGLFMYASIWLREHNRVCTILRKEHPHWVDERLYQTGKLIITGELIKIVIEDYVNHLANYNLKLTYNPELVFDHGYDYDNRIHVEFNHMYHWHPFSPDEYNISGSTYSIQDFMYHPEIVVKHGMSSFVDSMSKGLCGQMSHHNHGAYTLDVAVEVIKHQRELRMQSFNNYRKHFALEPYKSFEELTGDPKMSAELQEVYGDVNAVDLYVGFFLEKGLTTSPFGITMIAFGAPYSLRGLLSNPVSSPTYWKPSTFGGDVGFDMVKTASLEKLFCQNIAGECPLVTFTVPDDIARETRKVLEARDEL